MNMMKEMLLYHEGYKHIEVRHNMYIWRPRREIARLIKWRWSRAREKNKGLKSVPMLRLDEMVKQDDRLVLHTSVTDFQHHIGTRSEKNPLDRANPVYVSAKTLTRDDWIVFGLRANCENDNGLYDLASGAVHPVVDSIGHIPSLESALYRTIQREFGLERESFRDMKPKMAFGLKSDPSVTFLYDVRLWLNRSDVLSRFESWLDLMGSYSMKPQMEKLLFLNNKTKSMKQESLQEYYRPKARAILSYLSYPNVVFIHAR